MVIVGLVVLLNNTTNLQKLLSFFEDVVKYDQCRASRRASDLVQWSYDQTIYKKQPFLMCVF